MLLQSLTTLLVCAAVLHSDALNLKSRERVGPNTKLELFVESNTTVSGPYYDTVNIAMPWESGHQPLVRCPQMKKDEKAAPAGQPDDAETQLQLATSIMCKADLGSFVEFYVDPRFTANYERLKGKDGWIEKAFVTYMKLISEKDKRGAEEDMLVQSVHHFSKYPVVLTNVGTRVPSHLTPERFPNLVIMHARKSVERVGVDFNFNKLNAILFTKVKTGIVLDADEWVTRDVDMMFQRASEETTSTYPYPILPVHFMTRDPTSGDYGPEQKFHFRSNSSEVPNRTMSWGHAHPTWTYYALPWLAKWVSHVYAPKATGAPDWFQKQLPGMTDEDLLNIASWTDGLTKQWCKFDVEGADMYKEYFAQDKHVKQERDNTQGEHHPWILSHTDPHYQADLAHPEGDNTHYPHGIPHVFVTCHDAKDPVKAFDWLTKLWKRPAKNRLAIHYDGMWFADGKALKEYDPKLNCMI